MHQLEGECWRFNIGLVFNLFLLYRDWIVFIKLQAFYSDFQKLKGLFVNSKNLK